MLSVWLTGWQAGGATSDGRVGSGRAVSDVSSSGKKTQNKQDQTMHPAIILVNIPTEDLAAQLAARLFPSCPKTAFLKNEW